MASLKDISKDTGFSIRTVNRALTESGPVKEETKKSILEASKRLGYRPNLTARSLKTGISLEISAIVGSTEENQIKKLEGFEQVFREAGYSVAVLLCTQSENNNSQDIISILEARRPAGVAVFQASNMPIDEIVSVMNEKKIPYIILAGPAHCEFDNVRIDRQQGVYESIKYLHQGGRNRIAYVGLGGEHSRTRLDGYERAIQEINQEPIILLDKEATPIHHGDLEYKTGYDLAKKFLELDPLPDAVQTHSDNFALGFMAALHDEAITIPDQVAVVGFDDLEMASYSWPELTTVQQPSLGQGTAAAKILFSKIRGDEVPEEGWSSTLPTKLIIRKSA